MQKLVYFFEKIYISGERTQPLSRPHAPISFRRSIP